MGAREKLVTWILVIGLVIIALAFWLSRASSQTPTTGTATMGPLTPIGPTGNTAPESVVQLCMAAPLNSFGPACEGISWDTISGAKVDRRTAPTPVPDDSWDTILNYYQTTGTPLDGLGWAPVVVA